MNVLVSYDPQARATYLKLTEASVARTVSFGDLVMVDVDAEDHPVGVEFLTLPERVPGLLTGAIFDRFPELEPLAKTESWLHVPA